MIGPYHLLQLIGEGGMGAVWLAEQRSPVRRRVALKIIKAGMDSREMIARFESERQALAVMDHPAIAKVYDAGSTAAGVPYFAMEYVAGMPIADYCDKHRLSMRARLDLFVQVCEGVQHAHQKAIIHRDLKPSNILVTNIDDKAVPKIIDFGVAKAISQRLTPHTMFTHLGALIGTPEYMSPEQADPRGQDIDTRTDVYSLGVIFYELLVGTRPLDFSDLRNIAFEELLRRLREDDAPRPSTKLKTLGGRSTQIAQNRQFQPAALGKELRGDLDSIALKALEKDRSRRYDSPSEMAADIRRYLKDEPVLASPPSLPYRARKFVRRHRGPVAAASILALAVLALAITMTIQSARIARERDRANREAEAAERVSDFLVGIFKISDPDEARGNKVTAREILDRGALELDAKLAGQPQLQARMMTTISQVYQGLGLYEPAKQLVDRAVQIRKRELGPEHRDTLNSQRLLARLDQYQGHYADAEKLYQQTLAAQKRSLGPEDADTLRTEAALGGLYSQQGRYSDAQRVLSLAVDASRRNLGDEHHDTLSALHSLAIAYDGLHEYAKEESLWSDLVQLRTRVLGQDHPDTVAAMSNLAYVNYRQGKLGEAERLQRQTLETTSRLMGPDHPDVFTAMGNLANTLTQEHRLGEAEALQRAALDGRLRVLGADNPDTLFAMNNLAGVLEEEGKYKDAEALYRKALAGETRVLGANHPEVGYVWYNLAGIAAIQGQRTNAFESLRQAIDHGYADPDELASDDNWKSLRNDSQYQSLLEEVRRKAQVQKH
ncbi:MAG TPA: serine/threonine-protein kinase [Terracidiphilus sp.]|nr:serine/threonine-protein kinase [Terracidiphilus sp.]